MKPINNYDSIKEAGGEIENLPAGGYVCRIEKCVEKPNRNNNGSHLEIMFDIVEGEYKGWFADDWKNQTREDKYWHGIIRQNIPDETSPKYDMQCGFFKRFTNNIETSNPGYHWDWNEAGLKGKMIGVVFGEVERESQRGTRYMTTQADSIVSVDAVRSEKYKLPAPKMLAPATAAPAFNAPVFTPVDDQDGDLPF